jgi:hypothetical protein
MSNSIKFLATLTLLIPNFAFASVMVELNKLEQKPSACRIYLVIENTSNLSFNSFKLDVVLFNKEAIISKNMAVELAPLPLTKKSVKAFDAKNIQCENIGSLLINKIYQCSAESGDQENCLSLLNLSSKNSIPVRK